MLTATFNVRGIRIKTENVTNTTSDDTAQSQDDTTQTTNTTEDTSKFNQLTGAVDNTLAP